MSNFITVDTLAYSIFRVQQPEYISAPFRACLALLADSVLSNLALVKKSKHFLRIFKNSNAGLTAALTVFMKLNLKGCI